MTLIARASLEWWRASGERTTDRLRQLVEHYATINGEADQAAHHYQAALAAVQPWEVQSLTHQIKH